ncbi:MAG: hypothetical protein FGM24_04890 [Candidatus Kapabacteria bacterium]|nr:hypothetical protein [Candidatus Kapabacteria bacterium]
MLVRLALAVALVSSLPLFTTAAVPDTARALRAIDSIRLYEKERVVVTGTRNDIRLSDSPIRVEVIGNERIRTTAMVNVGDLLKEQTGLLMTGAIRNGIQMNGLGADYTMILIDGQPVVGRVAGILDLSRISVGNIERVEVVKGPMSSMYGSEALAGVVNIITKRPDQGWSGRVSAQSTSLGPTDLQSEVGWANADVETSVFVNVKQASPFSLKSDTLTIPYAGFHDGTVHAKLLWKAGNGWRLRSTLRAFGSETEGTFIESVFGQIAQNKGSVTQWDLSGTLGADWTHGRARLQTTAYATTFQERYVFDTDQGGRGRIDDQERRNTRLFTQYDLLFGEKNRMTLGGEFLYDDIGGTRYFDSISPNSRPFYRTGVAFAQWEGIPTSWISYVLSARIDANNVYGEALSPRFALLYKPDDHWRIGGSIGTGFKAPDFRQLFVAFSNRLAGAGYDLIGARRLGVDLEAERSISYDLRFQYDDGRRVLSNDVAIVYNAEFRLFRNDISNLIENVFAGTIDGRTIYSYRNISAAMTQGLEATLRAALVYDQTGVFSFDVGFQYLDARDLSIMDAIERGEAGTIDDALTADEYGGLWLRSQRSGSIRLQFDTPERDWSAALRVQLVGRYGDESLDKNGFVISNPPRRALDRPDEYVAGYAVVNLALTRSFTWTSVGSVTIGAGINNLLDVVRPTLIPGLVGRQAFLQSSIRF